MSNLIHVANVLILVSFCVKEILWLRILSIIASVFFILYFLNEQLTAPIWWNVLFSIVNLYQLWRLILSRRPAKLNQLEQRIHQQVFPTLRDRDLKALVALAVVTKTPGGETVVKEGQMADSLFLIDSGTMQVIANNTLVSTLGQNRFFGEMSFLSETPSRVDITPPDTTTYLVWSRASLVPHLNRHPDTYAAVQKILGEEMIRKYRASLAQSDS